MTTRRQRDTDRKAVRAATSRNVNVANISSKLLRIKRDVLSIADEIDMALSRLSDKRVSDDQKDLPL